MHARARIAAIATVGLLLCGCDGKDPERLSRVGKKLVEKSRRFADDADLPRVTITKPNAKTDDRAAQTTK